MVLGNTSQYANPHKVAAWYLRHHEWPGVLPRDVKRLKLQCVEAAAPALTLALALTAELGLDLDPRPSPSYTCNTNWDAESHQQPHSEP